MSQNYLIPWLRGILDEDERIANAVSGSHEDGPGPEIWVYDDDYRHDTLMVTKRAVLADIAAKRAILDLCETFAPKATFMTAQIVRQLGAAYSHRPGYRDAWA